MERIMSFSIRGFLKGGASVGGAAMVLTGVTAAGPIAG